MENDHRDSNKPQRIPPLSLLCQSPVTKAPAPSENLKLIQKSNPSLQAQAESQLSKKISSFTYLDGLIQIRGPSTFERLELRSNDSQLGAFILAARRIAKGVSQVCRKLHKSVLFEAFIILVIAGNTLTLALETPTPGPDDFLETLERDYLYIYTGEAAIKIIGNGLVFPRNSYLKNKWNLLDFTIVLSGWMEIIVNNGVNLSALRALRILRPLKSISSIQGMRTIFNVLVHSFKPLMSTLLILLFFFLVFAIAGMNLWMGLLTQRCLDVANGHISVEICGFETCGGATECVRGLDNPNHGVTNFDNILYSLLAVYQVVTLEGWSEIMVMLQKAHSFWIFLYFVLLLFSGAFFLVNLTLAVIKRMFTKVNEEDQKEVAKRESEHLVKEDTVQHVEASEYIEERDSEEEKDPIVRLLPEFNRKVYAIVPESQKRSSFYMGANPQSEGYTDEHRETYEISIRKSEIVSMVQSKHIKRDILQGNYVMLKLAVNEDTEMGLGSYTDVLPMASPDDTGKHSAAYTFVYKSDSDCTVSPGAVFSQFSEKTSRMAEAQAYELVTFSALEEVASVIKNDRESLYVEGEWSGKDVSMSNAEEYSPLNRMEYYLWSPKWYSSIQKLRNFFYLLTDSRTFNNAMTAVVVLNTLTLALDHHGISADLEQALNIVNYVFTITFILEMGLKLLGLGVVGYLRDPLNYLDGLVVVLSLIELFVLSDDSALSALRTVRIFRAFRVIRVARIFRYLDYMGHLIEIISHSIRLSIYLALLLLVFTIIFALLGIQLFGGKYDFPDGKPRAHFDDFHLAFVTVFQLLTTENWPSLLYDGMRAAGQGSALFFVIWIFLGNFVLLNLFLAILLDSFRSVGAASGKEERVTEAKKSKILQNIEKKLDSVEINDSENFDLKKSTKLLLSSMDEEGSENSLYCMGRDNPLRKKCLKLVNSSKFEGAILFLIISSSVKLVYDTYILDHGEASAEIIFSRVADAFFTVLFALEVVLKVSAYGFATEKGAYLRDKWNQLDMLIAVLSVVELTMNSNISAVKVIRLLRTLRPLRFITHNLTMKIVVNALFNSIKGICNVGIVILIVWLIFAILGVSLFGGKFYSCGNKELQTETECLEYGYEWENANANFDNVISATLTLFIVSSLEGWPDIMYQGIDATEVGRAPQLNANPMLSYYFIVFIIIGSFFYLNLFIGTVFESFQKARDKEVSVYRLLLTPEQEMWFEMMTLIGASKPQVVVFKAPQNRVSQLCRKLVTSPWFEVFILACIVLNMLQMAAVYDGAPSAYLALLEGLNMALTGIFVLEAAAKITGLGFYPYFHENWNKFDLFVVVTSVAELLLEFTAGDELSYLRMGPQLIRVFRVLRVTKLFRLVKTLEDVQSILETIKYSIPSMLNILSLLLLIFFIFSILGVFLFHEVPAGQVIGEYTNFKDFGYAMLALLRVSTGEEWNLIMYDCAHSVGFPAYIFFSAFQVITGFVMLNLFMMVLLEGLDIHYGNPDSLVDIFNKTSKKFKKIWAKYSVLHKGAKINHRLLTDLMFELGPPLGATASETRLEVAKEITYLSIPVDQHGYAYFHDILFCLYKNAYGKFRLRNVIKNQGKILIKKERSTLRKINKIRINREHSNLYGESREAFIRDNFIISSPYQMLLLTRKVFKNWRIWVQQRQSKHRARGVLDHTERDHFVSCEEK